jgi:protein TonB
VDVRGDGLRDRPEPMADAAPPAAIMIDLAEMAMAPAAVEEQIAPDEVDSEAAEAVEAEPVEEVELAEAVEPEEVVEEVVETPPDEIEPVETAEAVDPEEVEQVEPIDPVEEMVAALDPVEVPLPIARPEPRREEPKPEPPRRKPQQVREKPKPAAPSTERRKARVEAPREAPRAAAPQNSSGASSSVSPARWQARLASHLERRKRYPSAARRQGQQGTAQVRFTIDGSGNVQSVSLVRSSGVALLDEEVVALVRRASPVPAPPPGVNRTIVVPIRFSVR